MHQEVVKTYCPRCRQVYEPPHREGVQMVDGAYFGTTFPHLFFMTFDHLLPAEVSEHATGPLPPPPSSIPTSIGTIPMFKPTLKQ